jgi:hypothetical protein
MSAARCDCKMSEDQATYYWRLLGDRTFVPEASRLIPTESVCEDRYDRLVRERASAYHEAGHAVSDLASGAKISVVVIGAWPAALSAYPSASAPLLRLLGLAAGHYCEGLASNFGPPLNGTLQNHIELARAGHRGLCDACRSATLLCENFRELADEDLLSSWRSAFDLTRRLFATPAWREALYATADALRDRIRLSGEDVAALADVAALRAAQAEVLANINMLDPDTWGLE